MVASAGAAAQVHMPLFDPAELLLLAVFRDPGATSTASRVFGHGASLVGKLRLRLSTLAAGRAHAAALPLCADRKAGSGRAANVHLRLKVEYFGGLAQARGYLSPPLPADAYRQLLATGPTVVGLHHECKRIVLRWLEAAQPPIPAAVAAAVLGNERSSFVMSRALAHWRRVILMKRRFACAVGALRHVQSWQSPASSLAVMACAVTLAFFPQARRLSRRLSAAVGHITLPYTLSPPEHAEQGGKSEVVNSAVHAARGGACASCVRGSRPCAAGRPGAGRADRPRTPWTRLAVHDRVCCVLVYKEIM